MTTKTDKGGSSTDINGDHGPSTMESGSVLTGPGDLLSLGNVDHALAAKMHLVNLVSAFRGAIGVRSWLY